MFDSIYCEAILPLKKTTKAVLSEDCIMFNEIKFTKKESLNVLEAETELKMFFKQYKKKNKIKI